MVLICYTVYALRITNSFSDILSTPVIGNHMLPTENLNEIGFSYSKTIQQHPVFNSNKSSVTLPRDLCVVIRTALFIYSTFRSLLIIFSIRREDWKNGESIVKIDRAYGQKILEDTSIGGPASSFRNVIEL